MDNNSIYCPFCKITHEDWELDYLNNPCIKRCGKCGAVLNENDEVVSYNVEHSYLLGARYTRERCQICCKTSAIGFKVPDEVWQTAVHPKYWHGPLCLTCFIGYADEKLIEWDKDIQFHPVSLITHLQGVLK